MRLYHILFAVLLAALLMAAAREDAGRVAIVVFFTGLGEIFFGVMALMALFQTVGAIGEANTPLAYIEALAATAVVLLVATAAMNGLLWIGVWLLQSVVA